MTLPSTPDTKKKSIHVFASDFLPYPGCPRTAGGNRSMQIISALRKAGHNVTFSMPLDNYLGKKNAAQVLPYLSQQELWACEKYREPEVVLNRLQPDISITCNINAFQTISRFTRDIVHILDLNGPVHFEGLLLENFDYKAAMHDPVLMQDRCYALVRSLREADYLMTVSDRQKYFWSAYCSLAGFSFSDLNILVCPAAFEVASVARNTAADLTVVYSGGFYPWQQPDRFLRAAALILEEIKGATLHIFGAPHTGFPNEPEAYELLEGLQKFRCVKYHGYRPIEELLSVFSSAWCALELMEKNIERELAITGRTIVFLSSGTPVIYNDYSTLSNLIKQYNAGWALPTTDESVLRSVFEELVRRGPAFVDELSANARRLADCEFSPERSMAPLVNLCNGPVVKRSRAGMMSKISPVRSNPSSPRRVLAITPGMGALMDVRVKNPLRALQRQRCIGEVTITGRDLHALKHDNTKYDAILTHRALPALLYHILSNLSLPFVLDVDDNLLARAAYRREPIEREIVIGLRTCSAMTVPTPKLVRMLEKYSGLPLAQKAFVTPNSLPFSESRSALAKQPSQIIWIQSDIAALTKSTAAVIRAVEDFSTKHRLPVILIGRTVLDRPQFSNQIEMGTLELDALLQLLEFAPTSIGVAPLETDCDEQTLDFIDGCPCGRPARAESGISRCRCR
jgi:glycosyltransferase involved in cell wall biosynthesis